MFPLTPSAGLSTLVDVATGVTEVEPTTGERH